MKKKITTFMALMASLLISARCFAQDPLVPFDAHSTIWGGMFAPQSPEAMAITRSGTITEAVPVDDFSMSYSGNTLSSVNNSSYSFDSAGNITYDPLRDLSFEYNLLGKPYAIIASSDEADYIYLADGTKVKVFGESNEDGYAYLGSLVFALSEGDWLFDSTPFYGGQIRKPGSSYVADRFAADHLGSVRALVRNGQVLERNDYYPYGMRHANSSLTPSSANRWRFSAKEIQTTAGVNLIDFGARLYDDRICRWTSQDPLAAKYPAFSPYAYCAGDPVNLVDPDGLEVRPKGEKELEMIKNTLPQEARQYVRINENGIIDKNYIKQYGGDSQNYSSLLELCNSPIMINVSISDCFSYLDSTGQMKQDGTLSYIPYEEDWPEAKDATFELVNGLSTGESGSYGKTLFPDLDGEQNSTSQSIDIFIHPGLSGLGASEAFSHEGYGHALLYIRNGGDHQGASHQPKGLNETNYILRNMILSSRRETASNY